MRILMRNAQLESRIGQIRKNSPLFQSLLLLEKRKAQGSLQFTETFETDELVTYLDMAERVTAGTNISGTEQYPGMMLRPHFSNVTLPPDIFQLLKDYYHDLYGIQHPIGPVIQQFGRLQLGSEIYGATISLRHEKRSYIRAKFLAQRDNTVDIYPGQVQFYFQHTIQQTTHHLAFVRWYQPHQTRRFNLALENEVDASGAEIWKQDFYPDSRDCIIPVQMILSRFVPYNMQFTSRNRSYNVLVIIPINKRFHI
jgi:hypothetical protein